MVSKKFANFALVMAKENWRPGTMVYPLPAVIVTVGATPEEWNPITVAWTGTICSDPAMCYISVRRERHSFDILMRRMEFTINLTTADMARATDWVGVRSGRDHDKWKETGLTPLPGVKVASPTIGQSPLSIECRVKSVTDLGSHCMFVADVLNVRADDRWIDPVTGRFSLEKSGIMTYCHGHYYALGEMLGKFGFSVQKKQGNPD